MIVEPLHATGAHHAVASNAIRQAATRRPVPAWRIGILLLTALTITALAEETVTPVPTDDAWLMPLLQAADGTFETLPALRAARLGVDRSRIAITAATAVWHPEFNAGLGFDQGVRDNRPAPPYPPNANPATLSLPSLTDLAEPRPYDHRADETTAANLGIAKDYNTGTTVRAGVATSRTAHNDAVNGDTAAWNHRVEIGINQQLLRGRNPQVNDDPILDARDALATDQDRLQDERQRRFGQLCSDWIALGRAVARFDLAVAREQQATDDYETARLSAIAQIDTKSVLSRERDLVQQRANRRAAERRLESLRERFSIDWPGLMAPAIQAAAYQGAWQSEERGYDQTRQGRILYRGIDTLRRQEEVVRDGSRDELILSTYLGFESADGDSSLAWRDLGLHRDYDWGIGLTFRHRLFGNRQAQDLRGAILATRQAQENLRQTERDWSSRRETLSLALIDARESIVDATAVLAALQKEMDVLKAEAEGGLIQVRELLRMQDQFRSAEQVLLDARFNAMEAEVDLRAHLDRLPLPTRTADAVEGAQP